MVEIYQKQLQEGKSSKEVAQAWQNDIFAAKQSYLDRGVDFSLAVAVTFSFKNVNYVSGWSVGDIGV